MSLFICDYGVIDCTYLVHAIPVDPCEEHEPNGAWLIALVMDLGVVYGNHPQGYMSHFACPSRKVRDAVMEDLIAFLRTQEEERKQAQARREAQEEDEEEML